VRIEEPNQAETVVELRPTGGPDWRNTPGVAGGIVIAVILVFGLGLFALDRSDDTEAEADQGEVVVVPNTDVIAVPTESNERLVLAGTWTIEPGDFVTTKPGPNAAEGFLLKALSKEESDGRITLDTEAASLFEAVPRGSLVANPAAFQKLPPTQAFGEYAYADFDPGEIFNWLACEHSTKKLGLDGIVKRAYEPFFDMSWKRKGRPTRWIEGAEVGVRGNITAHATAKTHGKLECTVALSDLTTPVFGAVVFAGPVPVPITVHASASLKASANARAKLEATVSAGIDGYVALAYQRGEGKKLSGTARAAPELSVPLPKAEASAKADVKVRPGIGMTVGWSAPVLGKVAATAKIHFETGVEASWEKDRQPPAEACVPLSLGGQIIFHLLRKNFKPSLPDYELAKKCVTAGPPDGSA
jgi:hypothetical protein